MLVMDQLLLGQILSKVDESANCQLLIDEECQKYIYSMIADKYPIEAAYLKNAIKLIHIPLKTEKHDTRSIDNYINGAILLISSIIGCAICDGVFNMPILGVILGCSVGFYTVNSRYVRSLYLKYGEKSNRDLNTENISVILDNYINAFSNVCELIHKHSNNNTLMQQTTASELETRYSRILTWLHSLLERIEGNEWIEKDIEELLKHYGYEFVDFSMDNMCWFEKSPGNVEQCTTSIPALVNIKTNRCIIKGHVITPR